MTDLKPLADAMIKALKQEFKEKNLNDTGEASNSLSAVVGRNSIVIEGLARILFLEFGRRPGPEDWRELMPFILPWVRRKINPEEEGVYPIAKTIAKKIAKEGTEILTDPAKGLQIEITLGKVIEEMVPIIAEQQMLEVTGGLIKAWQS